MGCSFQLPNSNFCGKVTHCEPLKDSDIQYLVQLYPVSLSKALRPLATVHSDGAPFVQPGHLTANYLLLVSALSFYSATTALQIPLHPCPKHKNMLSIGADSEKIAYYYMQLNFQPEL
jgi:hypothetical protein